MQLDIYAEFRCFTTLLVSLAPPPQAFFEYYALTESHQLSPESPQLILKQVVKLFTSRISFFEAYLQCGLPIVGAKSYCRNFLGQLTRQGSLS